MPPKQHTVTSKEIGPALRMVIEQSPDRVAELRSLMQLRFDAALHAIESTPGLVGMVRKIAVQQSTTPAMANKFTSELLWIMSEQKWATPETSKDAPNLSLGKLGQKIHALYISQWYTQDNICLFSAVATEYLDTILAQYSHGDGDDMVQEWDPSEAEFDDGYNDEYDDEYDDEFDGELDDEEDLPQKGYPRNGEINLVKILVSMMSTYITMLANIIEDTKTPDNIRSALKCEHELWRWESLANIAVRLKFLLLDHQLCAKLTRNNYNFREDLKNFLEDWDSYAMIIDGLPRDIPEGEKDKT